MGLEVRLKAGAALELLVTMGDDRGNRRAAEPLAVVEGSLELRYRLVSPRNEGAEMPRGWSWSGQVAATQCFEVSRAPSEMPGDFNESVR